MHNLNNLNPLISFSIFITFTIFSLHTSSGISDAPSPQPPARTAPIMPLFTSSRWIVDGSGWRVKLACVNWPAHLEVAVAEGLSYRPLDAISKTIVALGFSCVRLTWPTYLVTNKTVASTTVRASFLSNGLGRFVSGLEANNHFIVDLPLIKAFQAVVKNLAENKLMIILDNHVTRPGWCCGNDGNGFFGDEYFSPDLWLQGLKEMATMYKGTPNVVAMSLRNELRGRRQNANDWYRYMQRGAEVVHEANPDVLIILSGLSYDLDLSFLKTRRVRITFVAKHKLAFEVHRYSFSGGRGSWTRENANDACSRMVDDMKNRALFLPSQGWPLILTEFGADLTGENENDNRYFSCLVAMAAEFDLDWAYWELGGSYYKRFSVIGMNETYGLLNYEWNSKNSTFLDQLYAIQPPFQGPGVGNSNSMHQIIFHPMSGKCIVRKSDEPYRFMIGPCSESQGWRYTAENGTLAVNNGTSYLYLQAQGKGKEVRLVGSELQGSIWNQISSSKMHLSSQLNIGDRNGTLQVCLGLGAEGVVITEDCKCLSKDNVCNPASQWFKIINATRN